MVSPVIVYPDVARVSSGTFQGVMWGGFALATVFTALRFAIRYRKSGTLFVDDGFVAFAWIIALSVTVMWQVFLDDMYLLMSVSFQKDFSPPGNVSQQKEVPPPETIRRSENFLKVVAAMMFLFPTHLWTVKLAFCVFFKRLYSGIKVLQRLWYATVFFTVAAWVVCVGDIYYGCYLKSFSEEVRVCGLPSAVFRMRTTLIVNCVLDLVTDATIIGIPVYILWGARISLKRRLAFAGLFCVTFITMAVAICRAAVLASSTQGLYDLTWLNIWGLIEIDAAMIVAGLGSCGSLFLHGESPKEQLPDAPPHADEYAQQQHERPNFFSAYVGQVSDLFSSRASGNATEAEHAVSPPSTSSHSTAHGSGSEV